MSPREKAGAAIAIVFVFLAFILLPIVSRVNYRVGQLNGEIKKDEKLLAEYLRYMNQKGIVTSEYQKYEKFVKKSGSDEEEQTKMLGEIEQLARKTGVSIVNMKPLAPRPVDYYKIYEVSIEAEGGMESLVDFVYQISQSAQLLRAEKVALNLKEKGSSVVKGVFSVTKVVIP
jgi:Tfp pilus assembly protein PilO